MSSQTDAPPSSVPLKVTITPNPQQSNVASYGTQSGGDVNFSQLEQDNDLPAGLMSSLMNVESSGDTNAVNNDTATGLPSVGAFQLQPSMQKELGVKNPRNLSEVAPKVAGWLSDHLDANDGDLAKTLAEYNWGSGNVARKGMENMPQETRDHIDKVAKGMGVAIPRPASDDEINALLGQPAPATAAAPATPGTLAIPPDLSKNTGELSDDEVAQLLTPKSLTLDKNLTDQQIAEKFGYDYNQIKSSDMYRQGQLVSQVTDPNSFMGKLGHTGLGSALMGVADVGQAAEQLKAHIGQHIGAYTPADVSLVDLQAKLAEADYNQNWKGRQPGQQAPLSENIARGVGSMAVPLPGVGGVVKAGMMASKALPAGASLLTRAAVGATGAAAVGAAAAPLASPVTNVKPNAPDSSFWQQKGDQVKQGAEYGPVGAVAGKAIGAVAGKTTNAIKGVSTNAIKELEEVAAKHGVKLNYGNVSGNKFGQRLYTALENVPTAMGGTGKATEIQEHSVKGAAQKLTAQAYDKMINTKFQNMKEVNKAASTPGSPRQKEAQDLLDKIRSDKDWHDVIQSSGNIKDLRTKLISDKKYAKVEQLAGNSNVWVVNTNKAIDSAIKKAETVKGSSKDGILNELNRMKEDFNDPKQPNTYASLSETFTALGKKIDSMNNGSNPDRYGASLLQTVRDAIRADQDKFGTNSKRIDLKAAHDNARDFYKNNVVPLQAKKLDKLFSNDEPDRIYSAFIKSGYGDRAEQFYNALENKGKAAVRYGMINEALDRATNEKGEFDSKKFSKYIDDVQEARQVFFKGADRWELNGFKNLLDHTNQGHSGPGSHLLLGALLGEGMIGRFAEAGVHHVVVAAGTTGIVRWLLTSSAGKRILLASSEVKPNSPAMSKIVERIKVQSANVAANMAGNKEQGR